MKIDNFVKNKWFNYYLFLLFFAIPFFIWLGTILQGYIFVSGDGFSSFIAPKAFLNNSLMNGELPLWNPFLAGGIPNIHEVGMGVFYPVTFFISFLPPEYFLLISYSLHLAIGAFFTYLYLLEIGCNKKSAIAIAIVYELSTHLGGYRKSHMLLVNAAIFLPVILYFFERYLNSKNAKYLILASFAMAMQFLTGNIQYAAYTDIAVTAYILICAYKNRINLLKFLRDLVTAYSIYLGLIFVQLLPTAHLLYTYKSLGYGETTFSFFSSYSIHFKKLLMMLSPQAINELFQSGGPAVSSEMDIEIFLGSLIFFILVYGIINNFKDFKVKLSFGMMFFSFIYAANAHIPVLNKIIYHMPVLGGFRVPSRTLFVFIFFAFVISAITLSKLQEKPELEKMWNQTKRILIIFAFAFSGFLLYVNRFIATESLYFSKIKTVSLSFILSVSLILFLLYITRLINKKYNFGYYVFCLLFLLVTVFEVSKYSTVSHDSPISSFEVENELISQMKKDLGSNKLWVASPRQEYNQAFFGLNKSAMLGMQSLNSYLTFNNVRLYRIFNNNSTAQMNYSGLLTYYLNASKVVFFHNDLLSMLGVKYIMDPQGFMKNDQNSYKDAGIRSEVLKLNDIELVSYSTYSLFQTALKIKSNTLYRIDIVIDAKSDPQLSYLDFYAGPDYDKGDQEAPLKISKGVQKYSVSIFSGNPPMNKDVFLRLVSDVDQNLKIIDLRVSEVETKTEVGSYKLYMDNELGRYYENANAKPILYAPKYIKSINDIEDIYENLYKYNLLDNSYILEAEVDRDISQVQAEINIIKFTNNKIVAKINTSDDTFVNFSQNHFPGWVGFVDGRETPVYLVNGLIMGMAVPQGEHIIEFRFTSFPFTVGAIITLFTFIFAIILFFRWNNKTLKVPHD